MNEDLEKQLDSIEFYQYHPFLKPFIGKKYSNNELGLKILLVGESHYIKEPLQEIKSENLLYDWWSKTPPLINNVDDTREWYNTRNVIKSFMSDNKGVAYAIYREPCKIYNQCVLNMKYQENKDIISIFDSFAFMNYYQMPAVYEKVSLRNSLLRFNGETSKNHPMSDEILNKTEKLSNDIFLSVVEILKPDKIIFLSTEVYNAFSRQNKDYDENKIFATVHPTCAWWNRKTKYGLSGKERLVNYFNTLVSERN